MTLRFLEVCKFCSYQGLYRFLENFGQLWKLKIPFSSTWKVWKRDKLFLIAMEKIWISVWEDCEHVQKWVWHSLALNSVYVMFVCFGVVLQNTIHEKIILCFIENGVFLFLWGSKMRMKMSFLALEIWSFGFGKVIDIFLKEFVRTLCCDAQ